MKKIMAIIGLAVVLSAGMLWAMTIEYEFTMPVAVVTVMGIFAPIIIQLLKYRLSKKWRRAFAIGLSIGVGLVGVVVSGLWKLGAGQVIHTIVYVIIASQASYFLWWKKLLCNIGKK